MITLDEVVRSVLSEEGRNTTHEYLRYLNIANRGLKQLTMDVVGDTQVTLLAVDNTTLRADLPTGFISHSFVGLVGNDGKLHPLGAARDIPKLGAANATIEHDSTFASRFGGVFGLGGGQNSNGYYQPEVDRENNQMIFAATESDAIVYLEYVSDGRATNNETVVPEYAEEALMSFIYWKAIQKKRGVPQNEKYEARKDWWNEKRLARARICSFTKDEALQAGRKGFKLSPKL
jgi:hypothetical protein